MNLFEDIFEKADYLSSIHAQKSWLFGQDLAAKIRLRTEIYNAVITERERCAKLIERRNGVIPNRQEIAREIRNGISILSNGEVA